MKLVKDTNIEKEIKKVSDKEAEEAIIKILNWIGEDPSREGLIETPKRVINAYKEFFSGYKEDANKILEKTFGLLNITDTLPNMALSIDTPSFEEEKESSNNRENSTYELVQNFDRIGKFLNLFVLFID